MYAVSAMSAGRPRLCGAALSRTVHGPTPRLGFPSPPRRGVSEVLDRPVDAMKIASLLRAFRNNGHLLASVDPLGLKGTVSERDRVQKARELFSLHDSVARNKPLELSVWGLGHISEHAVIDVTAEVPSFDKPCTIRELVELLDSAYCGNVGVEYTHIAGKAQKLWIRHRMEQSEALAISKAEKFDVLRWLVETEELELFLARKFPSAKRFGLQGCDVIMPALFSAIVRAVERGTDAVEIGMAHRGRLNVLAHVLNKRLATIFSEFDVSSDAIHCGDVKYHLGTHCTMHLPRPFASFPDVAMHAKLVPVSLSISANPSHLEAVDPVVMGRARATADYDMQGDVGRVTSLVVHGDASFSGQGIVAETLQLGSLPDYTVGGMLHFIVNNQIGFTTAPHRSRSSIHCTDVAKSVGAPIFHVNADDPEAVVAVSRLAADWRSEWNTSVVVDIVGYRRFGHNEQDEPWYTQPLMYAAIKRKKPVCEMYAARLQEEGVLSPERVERMRNETVYNMQAEFDMLEEAPSLPSEWLASTWQADVLQSQHAAEDLVDAPTGCELDDLRTIGLDLSHIPPGFKAHKGIIRLMKERQRMALGKRPCDWAMAEALAFVTITKEGRRIRLAGQDTERGTFNHRHAALYDQNTERRFVPIRHANPAGTFRVVNSSLSEAAALGFEYGYSLTSGEDLVVWEAQFGDFLNTAQSIVDTFIATGEHRWYAQSALTILLPHGFEGQGPDHSSARVERILQLCADDPDNVPGQSPAQLAAVQHGFEVAAEGQEFLTRESLQIAIDTMTGTPASVTSVQAARIVSEIDKNNDGTVDKLEWAKYMTSQLRKQAALHANMCVIQPTTPANYFHALRRHVHRPFKKPLVIFTPKSLLHHKPCSSSLTAMGPGTAFQPVIPDQRDLDPSTVTKVVLCSGKLYYLLRRSKLLTPNVALVRVEELHPFPFDDLAAATLREYPAVEELMWAQEEPKNMGAWTFVAPRLTTMLRQLGPTCAHPIQVKTLSFVGPIPQPSPTASFAIHNRESQAVVAMALTGECEYHSIVRSEEGHSDSWAPAAVTSP